MSNNSLSQRRMGQSPNVILSAKVTDAPGLELESEADIGGCERVVQQYAWAVFTLFILVYVAMMATVGALHQPVSDDKAVAATFEYVMYYPLYQSGAINASLPLITKIEKKYGGDFLYFTPYIIAGILVSITYCAHGCLHNTFKRKNKSSKELVADDESVELTSPEAATQAQPQSTPPAKSKLSYFQTSPYHDYNADYTVYSSLFFVRTIVWPVQLTVLVYLLGDNSYVLNVLCIIPVIAFAGSIFLGDILSHMWSVGKRIMGGSDVLFSSQIKIAAFLFVGLLGSLFWGITLLVVLQKPYEFSASQNVRLPYELVVMFGVFVTDLCLGALQLWVLTASIAFRSLVSKDGTESCTMWNRGLHVLCHLYTAISLFVFAVVGMQYFENAGVIIEAPA